jgi:hypothetical protein
MNAAFGACSAMREANGERPLGKRPTERVWPLYRQHVPRIAQRLPNAQRANIRAA